MSVRIRYRKLASGGRRPFLDIYHLGQRTKESVDIIIYHGDPSRNEKLKLLEKIRAKREMELLSGQFNFNASKKKQIDFLKYWKEFIDEYQGRDVRLHIYSLRRFQKVVKKRSLPLDELDVNLCERYATYLRNPAHGINGETRYNYFQKLAITDYLYTKLPYPTYEDQDIQLKTDLVYDYLVGRYAA